MTIHATARQKLSALLLLLLLERKLSKDGVIEENLSAKISFSLL